jgi:hypothetical protein
MTLDLPYISKKFQQKGSKTQEVILKSLKQECFLELTELPLDMTIWIKIKVKWYKTQFSNHIIHITSAQKLYI